MNKSLHQLFEEFLYESEFVQKSRRETLRGYKQAFLTFNKLLPDLELQSLTPETLTRFFKILEERKRVIGKGVIKVGIKKSTVATYWGKLNSFFKWLKLKNVIPVNPFSEMKYPVPVYENRKYLGKEEIEKILTAILNHSGRNVLLLKRNLVLFYILLFCGLRREELALLQIRDIALDRRVLTVRAENSKSGRTRHLPLHSIVVLYLKDYLKERRKYTTPYLFVSNSRDDRLTYDGIKHLTQKLCQVSGVRFHLHQFRHTFAVNFLKTSNNIAKLKQLLGHQDIRMTMVYLRCLPTNELRGDIEALSIDNLI